MIEDEPTGTTGDAVESGADETEAALKEFDAATTPKSEPVAKPVEDDFDFKAELRLQKQARERDEAKSIEADFNKAAEFVRGDLKASDKSVRGWLDQTARENPAYGEAFLGRHDNPARWDRAQKALKKLYQNEEGPVDRVETDTTEAVSAAVRSASTKTVEAEPLTKEAWRKMSPEDRRKAQSDAGARPV